MELEADNPSPLAPDWCCPPSILTQDPRGIRRLDIWKPLVSLVAYLSKYLQHQIMNFLHGPVSWNVLIHINLFLLWLTVRDKPKLFLQCQRSITDENMNLSSIFTYLKRETTTKAYPSSIWCIVAFWGQFYLHGLTCILAWICNYIQYEIWDGITYLLPNFKGAAVEAWEWLTNFIPTIHWACDYLSMVMRELHQQHGSDLLSGTR